MIKNIHDLKYYLKRDKECYPKSRFPLWIRRLLGEEEAISLHFLQTLRLLEYFINKTNRKDGGIFGGILWIIHKRQRIKYGIHIQPNKVGPGLRIYHFGGGVYLNVKSMGEGCSVSTGVVCGNKDNDNSCVPTIGNNVQITVGSKIIGDVYIGDNSIIAPNSVVVKDVLPNSIVTGIPAHFLKVNNKQNCFIAAMEKNNN